MIGEAWRRLTSLVGRPAGVATLALLAAAVYAVEEIAWPMARGRDMWDYLLYYLSLLDGHPVFGDLMVFRTPVTPFVLGVPLQLGGVDALVPVFGALFVVSVVAWAAVAATFGRAAAVVMSVLLLGYTGYAGLFHQASSDAIFATGLACWALLLARTLERPSGWRFVALGAGIAGLVLIRAANEILLPLALLPLVAAVPWRRRVAWSAACLAAAVLPLAAWAAVNGVRYDSTSVQRGGRAWVPFLRVFTDDRTVEPGNGDASRRLGELVQREVLEKEPFAPLGVTLEDYFANGSNYETVRLIALSDRVLGRDENYGVLFESALEAIREHPRTYTRGVADTYWDFLMQAPLREDVAPREQTEPEPPPRTFESRGAVLPNPQSHVLLEAVRYGFVWCASDYIDSCTVEDPSLVWPDAASQRRYREIVSQVRSWDAELPSREGVSVVPELLNRITPRFPRPPLWLLAGAVALLVRRPRGTRTVLALWLAAGLVLLVHAISQGVAPEFALPLYPVFIVTALVAIAGDRPPGGRASS